MRTLEACTFAPSSGGNGEPALAVIGGGRSGDVDGLYRLAGVDEATLLWKAASV